MYELLINALARPIAKFLLQKFLQFTDLPGAATDLASDPGEDLYGIAATRITALVDQRMAVRTFEQLADQIVSRLAFLFENASERGDVNVEAVVFELQQTLSHPQSASFLAKSRLDPKQLVRAWHQVRHLPMGVFSEIELDLYERALDACALYLAEVAAELPRFQSTAVADQLRRLSAIDERLGEVLMRLSKIEEAVDLHDPSARFRADYLQVVERRLNYMDLFGVDFDSVPSHYKLSVAYVSLRLQDETTSSSAEEGSGNPTSVESLLDQLAPGGGRILIEGPAGSGKSALLRWVALMAARQEYQAFRPLAQGSGKTYSTWGQCIPFLIRLRDCRGGKLPNLDQYPLQITDKLGDPPEGWVAKVLKEGRALILFEGLDEALDQDRRSICLEIEQLCETYPHCYYLLSTRPLRMQLLPGFRRARISPLTHADRDTLIDRWHEAAAEQLRLMGNPSAGEMQRLADELKAELDEDPSIAQLATTPLLAAVICAIYQYRSQGLLRIRAELCAALCRLLFTRREVGSRLDISGLPESYRVKQVVTEFAQWMVINGQPAINERQALRHISNLLGVFQGRSSDDAREVLNALIEHSGMLRETQVGQIEFTHAALKEYLAGEYFASKLYYKHLAARAIELDWQQTVILAAQSGDQDFVNELMRAVLKRKAGGGDARKWELMAVRIGAAVPSMGGELQQEVERIRQRLLPPQTAGEAESLASFGDAVVPFLRYSGELSEQEAIASIRTLRLIDSRASRACLRRYARTRSLPVAAELAFDIEPLEIDCVRELLLRGEEVPRGIREQISDLSAVIKLPGATMLQSLNLSSARRLRDISALAGLPSLQSLNLSDTRVSDVRALGQLHLLRSLDLSGTPVTDVRPLARLRSLQSLNLSGTPVSHMSLAQLRSLESHESSDLQRVYDRAQTTLQEFRSIISSTSTWKRHFPQTTLLEELDGLRAELSEPQEVLGSQSLLEVLKGRLAPGGAWSGHPDRLGLLEQALCVPGMLQVPMLHGRLKLPMPEFSARIHMAIDTLQEPDAHPAVLLARHIYYLRVAAEQRPHFEGTAGTVDLREALPPRLLGVLKSAMDSPPGVNSFAGIEPSLLRLCADLVRGLGGPGGLPESDSIWLTFRLHHLLWARLWSSSEEGGSWLRYFANVTPEPEHSPADADLFDPVRFAPDRLNYRLVLLLHAFSTMEVPDLSLDGGEGRPPLAPRLVSSTVLEELLTELVARPLTKEERAIRERSGARSVLGWSAPGSVPELALGALLRVNPEAFLRLPEARRLQWIQDLPSRPEQPGRLQWSLTVPLVEVLSRQAAKLSSVERAAFEERLRAVETTAHPEAPGLLLQGLTGLFAAGHAALEAEIRALLREHASHPKAPHAFGRYLLAVASRQPERLQPVAEEILGQLEAAGLDPVPFAGGVGLVAAVGQPPGVTLARNLLNKLATRSPYQGKEQMRALLGTLGLS